jgi:hypothetical protein
LVQVETLDPEESQVDQDLKVLRAGEDPRVLLVLLVTSGPTVDLDFQ